MAKKGKKVAKKAKKSTVSDAIEESRPEVTEEARKREIRKNMAGNAGKLSAKRQHDKYCHLEDE